VNFAVDGVLAGGQKLNRRANLEHSHIGRGHPATRRIRHDRSREVEVRGTWKEPVLLVVDLNSPLVGTHVPQRGQFPTGVINWAGEYGKGATGWPYEYLFAMLRQLSSNRNP
jgi:hypothetical protein